MVVGFVLKTHWHGQYEFACGALSNAGAKRITFQITIDSIE
jgi:hypothetical protein